jgi:hypothetical protein
MTRRKILRKLASSYLAAVFLLGGLGDAVGAHECPHHDRLPGHVTPGEPAAPAHGHDHPVPAPVGHAGPCTCLGSCLSQAAVALPERAADRLEVSVGPVPFLGAANSPAPRQSLPAFLLPYANAPPLAL